MRQPDTPNSCNHNSSQVPSPPTPPPLPSAPAAPPHYKVQTARGAKRTERGEERLPRRLRTPGDVQSVVARQNPACVPLLIAALGSGNERLRGAAHDALPAFGEPSMLALLRAAAHGRGRIREEAVACLGEWRDVRALQPLLLALQNERKERNAHTVIMIAFAACAAVSLRSGFDPAWWSARIRGSTELRVRACRALGNLGDVRAIAPLIPMARGKEPEVAIAARLALSQLLPIAAQMPPGDARMLGPDGILLLISLLPDLDEPLVCMTLRALGALGDHRALREVQQVANDPRRPHACWEAAHILPVLYARVQQEQARSTLLRGAEPPHTRTADSLLRPVQDAPHSYPDELLRATHKNPDE
jgi:hypothetical protein